MATDSSAVLSFHDPFNEIQDIDSSAFFVESPTLGLPEILQNEEQDCLNYVDYQSGHDRPNEMLDPDDPFLDPVIWAFCNEDNADVMENAEAGPSRFSRECSSHGFDQSRENPVSGDNPMSLLVFSVPSLPQNCTCCQKLREITHTNGMSVKRLEIHGRFGVITHAVLEKYDLDSCFESRELQMFDFNKESTQSVKQCLVKYLEFCKQQGYVMLQDPLSTFYEALCVGLNVDDNADDFLLLSPINKGDWTKNQQEMAYDVGGVKIPLAVQRARTGNLKLKDFIDYFELPIEEAARKMNICPTVMKKICRRNGVSRWPYRKIRSIKRKISKKNEILKGSNNEEKVRAVSDLKKYQHELADIYAPFAQS